MEIWRQVALEKIPSLRELILAADDSMGLWVALHPKFAQAYDSPKNPGLIAAVHDYAWWCIAHSQDEAVASAAIVNFYEDLPVTPGAWEELHQFLDREQFEGLREVFKYMLNPQQQKRRFDEFLVAIRKKEKAEKKERRGMRRAARK